MKYLAGYLLFMACGTVWAQNPAIAKAGTGDLAKAHVFTPEQGSIHTMPNGAQSRNIVHAALATGEAIGIHESVQMPGTKPNPPHTIQHSEFILVREGNLVFEHNGLTEKAGPGSIIYVAYGTLHTVRNIGDTPAKYVVIAIGGDQQK